MLKFKRFAVACVSAAAVVVGGGATVIPAIAQAAPAAMPAASWYSGGIYTSSECENQVESIYLWGGTAYCEWHAPLAIGYEELWIKNG